MYSAILGTVRGKTNWRKGKDVRYQELREYNSEPRVGVKTSMCSKEKEKKTMWKKRKGDIGKREKAKKSGMGKEPCTKMVCVKNKNKLI